MLHGLGQRRELARHFVVDQHIAARGARRDRIGDRRGGHDGVLAIRQRIEANVAASRGHLQRHVLRRRGRLLRHRRIAAQGRGPTAGLVNDDLLGLGRAPLLVQALQQLRAAQFAQRACEDLRAPRLLAQPQVQRRARQDQCIVQALPDLDAEPAVDAAVYEVE